MENQVFERDYAEEHAARKMISSKTDEDVLEHAINNGFFKAYTDAMNALPKYIVPEDKKAYEELLPQLDALAMRLGGKIRGVVDYEKWDSKITVILPFFECSSQSEFALLADIAQRSDLLTITATEDGNVKLSIMINYFNEIGDKENLLEETIVQDEELVNLLMKSREEQKARLLSNPAVAAYLEKNAAAHGMTADELYDIIEAAFCSNPEGLSGIVFDDQIQEDEDNE